MLAKTQMQEIQDLKLRGYTKTEIINYYRSQGLQPPSRPTISKYYDMDVIPEDPRSKLTKDKVFDISPFKEAIIAILEANSRKDFCISSVYDVLEEKFIENGEYDSLPGNEQTLRNYVHYLEQSGQIDQGEEHRCVYDHVFDTPPGGAASRKPLLFLGLFSESSRRRACSDLLLGEKCLWTSFPGDSRTTGGSWLPGGIYDEERSRYHQDRRKPDMDPAVPE